MPRTLAKTPSSVAVVTSDMIEGQAAPDRVEQLLALIPNIQAGSGGEGPTIRGQDSTGVLRDLSAFLGGTRPRVTLQVDGRAVNYYEYVFGLASAWDVSQVEVFRSPQTTTQGRNSIAGAIFVHTADPGREWEARVRTIGGELGTWQGSAMVSGPIGGDQLAFRVSGDIRRTRNSSDMADGVVGASLDHDDYGIARVKLLAEPRALPGLRIEATYAHGESQAPQFEAVAAPFRARRFPAPERTNGVYRINTDSLTGVARYELTQALTWDATLSWGDALIRRFGLPGLGRTRIDSKDFSVESTLNWQPQTPVRLVGGIYRLTMHQRQSIDITGLGAGMGDFDDRQHSLGLFGEATWRPATAFAITGGLRYQRDNQDRDGILRRPGTPALLDYDRSFDAWLPKLSVAYDLTDGVTAGLLAQRAFNPGGATINPFTGALDDFDAETLWNYEAFVRASFGGGRGTLAANLFYNDIADSQRPQRRVITPPGGAPLIVTDIVNQPTVETYGAELELAWRATERLTLRLGAGLLETKVLRTLLATDPSFGKDFERAPSVSASAAVDWRPVDALRLSVQLRTNTGYFSDDANTPALRIAGSTVVNARAAYTHDGLTVFGYARNLFNEFYLTYLFTPTFGTAGDPRELGVGVEARF